MKDHRYVEELSIEELEQVLQLRKSQERLRRFSARPGGTPVPQSDVSQSAAHPHTPRGQPFSPRAATGGAPRYSAAVLEAPPPRRGAREIRWRWVWDRFLLFVEVMAFIGFLFVVAQLLGAVRTINEESREAFTAPTPTATPVIGAVILPGGHTPPDAQRRSQPAPIPAHLRDLVAAVTPLPVPTPGPEHARRIVIPAIGVDAPVVEGDDWESLKKGAGHHIGSANPGERGNCVISAHNDIYGEIFRRLPELTVGDEVLVYTETQSYRYVVQQTRIIEPTEVSVMAPTSSPVLTLISCYPYGVNTHRIVAIAELVP